jgi:hypothetical protein
MSDPLLLLQQVAAQLQQEGKTPSLALFRARLAGRVAPQQLFAAYQQWRANPITAVTVQIEPQLTPVQTASDSQALAQTLARIEAKLDLLLSKQHS